MKTKPLQQITNIWQKISTGSVNGRIFSAALVVAGGTLFVKVLAVVKELVVAWKFGTADELDAFLIALTIPSVLITIIAGSFNSALIPTYIKVREREGKKAAQKLFSGATVWSIGLLLITTTLIITTSPLYLPRIAGGFTPKKLELTYQLLWVVSPMILLTGINTVWGAVLNAGERFALVALAPILTPAVTIFFLFITQSLGIFNLALGMVVGQLLEMIIVGTALRQQGMSLVPRWYGFDDNLKEVAGQYAPMIAGAFLMCSTGLVDQSMAAMLPSGSVAALAYGNRIISLPITISSTALSTAVIPYFSQMVARDDWNGIRQALKRYMLLIFAITIPITGLIILASEPIVRILLQRGSFTAENTQVVAQIQACFALQIPFYISSILVVRINSAMRNNQLMMWGSGGNLIVNISMNYLFMQWFGVAGIALSTSCVYMFSLAFLLFFVMRRLSGIDRLGLTPEQQEKIQQLNESKFEQISNILTPEQREAFQQMQDQRPLVDQRKHRIDLSADQKGQLREIRRENMQEFRSILSPQQAAQLEQMSGLEKGMLMLFQQGFTSSYMQKMNFTAAQRAQIEQLLRKDRQEIDTVLTSEQQQKTVAMQSRRKAVKTDWESLSLTATQKVEMKAIRDAKKQELNAILTPEQQTKMKNGKGKYKIE